ncbi:hypothetical protein CYMTET_13330 [Cymbomonas tetramitiformis]|uniref:4-hydroxy-4-methyl-2-oxoglutarate aldolase n=1 Tax=Cymbomonas tetramitiformis TaxID=36881 RepID=A0AAE0GJV6_9CHLO|nr:hypothetical protein CYMTET_13330 [Cymbomonas tetramitiformis]
MMVTGVDVVGLSKRVPVPTSSCSTALPRATSIVSRPWLAEFSVAFSTTYYPPPDLARLGTADLCDVFHPQEVGQHSDLKIADSIFRNYGGKTRFSGKIATVHCYENNPLVRKALEAPGEDHVLVVDGGGSLRCALLGDNLAEHAAKNGWQGIILNACIRDSEEISKMAVGVKALNTHPLKSAKGNPGVQDVPVTFAGVTFIPGQYVYADSDGIVVSEKDLGSN